MAILKLGIEIVDYISKNGVLRNKNYYFKPGITYSGSGSKGTSFRIFPKDCLFDVGGSCIFLQMYIPINIIY